MRDGDLLVVLMRWPVLGTGKSRLAAALGAEAAHRLHRGFVADTLRWSAAWPRLVAFNPPQARREVARAAPGAELVAQPAGDLGTRLDHAFAGGFAAGARRVLLVGSDSPTLPEALLEACLEAAGEGTVSLVGAQDGGFVAIAAGRAAAARLPALFAGVEWSTARTAAQVTARARAAGLEVRRTGAWYDVDEAGDLQRLARDLARDPGRAPRTAAALAGLERPAAAACPPGC
jgi:rSAM/selenodomain-associated transferase 1